jgi:hypothetical protein
MSQRDAVRFLHDEGLPADAIHQHLVEMFGEKAMAYSTITRTLRKMSWTGPEIQKEKPPNFPIDATILLLLNCDPTASIRETAREARPPGSTLFYALTADMGYSYRRWRLVPHNLSARQRNDGLKQTQELLEVLQNAKRLRWRFVLTGDESWFFYVNEHQKLWLAPDLDPPEVARRRIKIPNVIVISFGNILGLHVSTFLAGESFDANYFVRNVLTPITHLPIVDVAHKQKKLFILHMDNSPIHKPTVIRAQLSQCRSIWLLTLLIHPIELHQIVFCSDA